MGLGIMLDYGSIANILIAIAIAFCRVCGFKSKAYQAIAHLFVGYLLGSYAMTGRHMARDIFWLLCIVEVVCFFVDRLIKPLGKLDENNETGIPR